MIGGVTAPAQDLQPGQLVDQYRIMRLLDQGGMGRVYLARDTRLHRDLKPGNVLIGRDGRVRVVDFGLAKIVGEVADVLPEEGAGAGADAADPLLGHDTLQPTRTEGIRGSPSYMAPEQWRGRAGTASDVWALGVTLHEMVAGRRPFRDHEITPIALAVAVRAPAPTPLGPWRDDVPPGGREPVASCLDKDPERRRSAPASSRSCRSSGRPGRASRVSSRRACSPGCASVGRASC